MPRSDFPIIAVLSMAISMLLIGCPDVQPVDDEIVHLSFEANDPEASGSMAPLDAEKGAEIALPACAFVMSGWLFAGWSLTPGGSVAYADQALISSIDGDLVLYARWVYGFTAIADRDMVDIEGGTFYQCDGTSAFYHAVSSFSMGRYEVTYALWDAVRDWATAHGYSFEHAGREGDDGVVGAEPTLASREPVTTIGFNDAIAWCNAYSEMSALAPVYSSGGTVLKDARSANAAAFSTAVCDWGASGFRLPTEGEWRYAASGKGGLTWQYASGATAPVTDMGATLAVAWFLDNSGGHTHAVGATATPSALGLWDVSGNAAEWCWDWYAEAWSSSSRIDYRGAGAGDWRVILGGSFMFSASSSYLGQRGYNNPAMANETEGLRVVRGR